ncbi:hypothetical protein NHP22001_05700 [Helicobacter sp. NHP22-001]|nr:hypothetical protein NHP22001_05700 [Helicobacter sp. NHP22-001]
MKSMKSMAAKPNTPNTPLVQNPQPLTNSFWEDRSLELILKCPLWAKSLAEDFYENSKIKTGSSRFSGVRDLQWIVCRARTF